MNPSGTLLSRQRPSADALDRVFQALADPTRRSLLERLSEKPASATELAEPLSISLPAVVQHLQVLEASGLVQTEKVGRVRMCRLEPAALHGVERWIQERRRGWERRFDRLGELLVAELDGATEDGADQDSPGEDRTGEQSAAEPAPMAAVERQSSAHGVTAERRGRARTAAAGESGRARPRPRKKPRRQKKR